jgi:hypothetical protein
MIGQVSQGSSRSFSFQVLQADLSTPSAAYLSSDVLTAKVWPGDIQMVVATPAASWIDATVAKWRLDFAPADTSTLIAGVYRVRVIATRGSAIDELLRDSVEVLVVAGAGAAPSVYCTYQDMAIECSWLQQYQDESEDETGFAEQRVRAREWMDAMILRAQPWGGTGLVSRQTYWSWTSTGGIGAGGGYGNNLAIDSTLTDHLAADNLMLTTPQGRAIVRACACYAIALVLRSQQAKEQVALGDYFMRRATAEASMITAEIDINADGRPEYAISLAVTNTRYA